MSIIDSYYQLLSTFHILPMFILVFVVR